MSKLAPEQLYSVDDLIEASEVARRIDAATDAKALAESHQAREIAELTGKSIRDVLEDAWIREMTLAELLAEAIAENESAQDLAYANRSIEDELANRADRRMDR